MLASRIDPTVTFKSLQRAADKAGRVVAAIVCSKELIPIITVKVIRADLRTIKVVIIVT